VHRNAGIFEHIRAFYRIYLEPPKKFMTIMLNGSRVNAVTNQHTHTPAKQTLLKQYPIRYAIAAREVVNNNQQETINELV